MKILFINLPYYGHVVPTIGLVQELIKQGCQVTYLLPFDWQEKIALSGADFAGYENHTKLSEQIKNAYDEAEKIIKNHDLVIYEQFFFLGKHLAEKYQKPVVRIFTAPVTNKRLMQEYIDAGGALGIFKHKWIGRIWTREVARNITLKTDCWLNEIVYNPPALNLVYTLEDYQPYIEDFPKEMYKFLGNSVYEREEKEFVRFSFDACRKDNCQMEKPLIYISLGTIVNGAKAFFKKCIKAFKEENVIVIMSVGKSFNSKRLGEFPLNFHVYQSVPQLEVLKRASVFVTHGGMNSISEALTQGVPMVVIPFMADQPTNARRIEELRLGKKLDCKKMTAEELRAVTFAVMKDNRILKEISLMKEKMSACPGNKAGACYIMEYYRESISEPLEQTIDRIQKMETYLDELTEIVHNCPNMLYEDKEVQRKLKELTDYYENGQWMRDYERDERGEFPKDLKRGVLSQDAVYNLLFEIEQYKNEMI